jgi:TonB C terminal
MDRAEAAGFGVAVAGHAALLAALALGLAGARVPPTASEPIEVSFVDEVGLESVAPAPAADAPSPPASDAPPPTPSVQPDRAEPVPLVPLPRQTAPARPAPAKPSRRPFDVRIPADTDSDGPARPANPPATTAGPAVQASLGAEVRRQLKPHWKAPTGADAELLRTELSISLAASGAVTGVEVVRTSGQTASNRPQVALHQEQAMRAVRLASPFRLPGEYYQAWKQLKVTFDKRLSQ